MDLEQTIMSLIVFGGNAKSDAMLAIDSAKKGILLKQTNKSPKQNKHYLKRIILKQNLYKVKHVAKNRSFLLLVHAQDHLMNAITFKDLAKEIVDLYKNK